LQHTYETHQVSVDRFRKKLKASQGHSHRRISAGFGVACGREEQRPPLVVNIHDAKPSETPSRHSGSVPMECEREPERRPPDMIVGA